MTAADVAFTFNLIKKVPALDVNSVWSVLSSVTQAGDNVVMTFKAPSVPYFYYIADQVPIVPEHIWSKISNPVTYADSNPIGTGAYIVKPCTPQNITYVANPDYWQPGEPKVAKVLYPAFTSNDPANTYLATGQAQWGSQFIPNIQAFYTSKSPDNHYWFPPYRQRLADPEPDRARAERHRGPAGDRLRDRPEQGRQHRRVRRGARPPTRPTSRSPTFSSWLDSADGGQVQLRLQPGQGEANPHAGGLHARQRRDLRQGRQAAVVQRHQHRRLLGLGRLDVGDPAGAEGRRHRRSPRTTSRRTTSCPACTPATSSSPTTRRPAARRRTTSSGSGCTRRTPRRSARTRRPTGSGTATRRRTSCSTTTR